MATKARRLESEERASDVNSERRSKQAGGAVSVLICACHAVALTKAGPSAARAIRSPEPACGELAEPACGKPVEGAKDG